MIRFVSALLILATPCVLAADLDEFKIKREESFEFTEKPKDVPE